MPRIRSVCRVLAAGLGLAAGAYLARAGITWSRYGRARPPRDPDARDPLLDRFMPDYEVVERHHIAVAAPAGVTYAAAREMDIKGSGIARAVFRTRELVLGASGDATPLPRGLVDQVLALGWRVLAEVPGRELVVGAVTRPWEADVTFRGLPPAEFAAFDDPGFVKIAWTLRADPVDETHSVFRTETRALATDAAARAKFRRYWAFLSPGIVLIRQLTLRPLRQTAERHARAARVA